MLRVPLGTHAVELVPARGIRGGGIADHSYLQRHLGLVWPWSWRHEALGGELTATTEAYCQPLERAVAQRSKLSFTQLGLLPVLRYRLRREAARIGSRRRASAFR